MRIGRHVEAVIQDVRFGIRLLLREPAFTATVLVTLALSIGSTTAVFTLVDVLLLRPLPVRSPERLFSIAAPGRNVDLNPSYYSHGFYEHLRTSDPLFRDLLGLVHHRFIRCPPFRRCGYGSRAMRARIR